MVSDKPRLGDTFTRINWFALEGRLTTHSLTTFRLGFHIFQAADIPFEPRLSPREVELAGDARAFGALKYQRIRAGWVDVQEDDHLQSAGRHFAAWINDPDSLDEESRVPHEGHFLARACRLVEMREERRRPR